jgi:hypothetical protein
MVKMNIITFEETGHVLGAVTRTSQPETPLTAQQVAAGGFRLRLQGAIGVENAPLNIPESEIKVQLVEYNSRALFRPHIFIHEGVALNELPEYSKPDLSVSGNKLTVTLPGNTTALTVSCLIYRDNFPDVISAVAKAPADRPTTAPVESESAATPLTLPSGNYRAALFAPGFSLVVISFNVP